MGKQDYVHVKKEKDGLYTIIHSVHSNPKLGGQVLESGWRKDAALSLAKQLAKRWDAEIIKNENIVVTTMSQEDISEKWQSFTLNEGKLKVGDKVRVINRRDNWFNKVGVISKAAGSQYTVKLISGDIGSTSSFEEDDLERDFS